MFGILQSFRPQSLADMVHGEPLGQVVADVTSQIRHDNFDASFWESVSPSRRVRASSAEGVLDPLAALETCGGCSALSFTQCTVLHAFPAPYLLVSALLANMACCNILCAFWMCVTARSFYIAHDYTPGCVPNASVVVCPARHCQRT